MNSEWIKALNRLEADATPAVMITVVDERGSTPRNAGAKMVVSEAERFDTIGGGHLEHKAIKIARAMLVEKQTQPRLERFSLGASLGQCCGGATTLLFEPLNAGIVQIALFGAGHVARALVPILATLPCRIRWIDSREDEFPASLPEGVEKVVNEFPVDEIKTQAADSYFIVMTHNHQLDQELTEAILKRNDFKYFGLIGSQTKRKKFEHRLKAKGFDDAQLERMTCPMGIPEVKGKLPAEIAVSVAGEVIAQYNATFGAETHPRIETNAVERLAV
ncbi:XdhC protein (assists in molybdopterin insertion into xanthine dehydrogenase) [Marinobacterium lacunae]|uniref:XdhC protein (Assists in molybdopterin insertion into xanthine dehydrogenase) n=1 Tax=Marinobacterium lacunae TaxID=1232683 RepID=A0A081FUJ4_9GAMM|nr:xanthine dehydrogenase accessory protein XdhC [Marinobacterium lacunae]KEA62199.1 XdhC protein (assists in molybdopterin insertion into xanthine dehydrogenase) [Marinobacterium lacunae]